MPGLLGDCATRPSPTLPAAASVFAGQADDPFFLDLRVFDLLYGGNLSEAGHDTWQASTSTDRASGAEAAVR